MPVLPALSPRELGFILRNSEASVVVTTADKRDGVAAASEGLAAAPRLLVVDGVEAEDGGLWPLMSAAEPIEAIAPRAPDDLAVILYTSGTTGEPKGVMQTHGNLESAVRQVNVSRRDREPGDVVLLVLPLAHTFGLSVLINGYMVPATYVVHRDLRPRTGVAGHRAASGDDHGGCADHVRAYVAPSDRRRVRYGQHAHVDGGRRAHGLAADG